MLPTEAVAIGIVFLLLVITTNPGQNRPHKKKEAARARPSRIVMASIQVLALLCAASAIPARMYHIGYVPLPLAARVAGLLLMLGGLLLRVHSMQRLGRHYSTVLAVRKTQPLITNGIYGVIRHPIYLGDLVLYGAIGLAVGNYVFCLIMVGASVPASLLRIAQEERIMIAGFGAEYVEYRQRTAKLIPFIF